MQVEFHKHVRKERQRLVVAYGVAVEALQEYLADGKPYAARIAFVEVFAPGQLLAVRRREPFVRELD